MSRTALLRAICPFFVLGLVGCGEGYQEAPAGPPGTPQRTGDTPRAFDEPTPSQDPVVQFPAEPVWREFWFPIVNPERDHNPSTASLLAAVGAREGMSIADVGAGGGYFAFKWASAVGPTGHVYATDVDWRMSRKLAWEASARGVGNLTARRVELGSIGVDPGSVDVVAMVDIGAFNSCNVSEHRGYVEQAARALRPGGRFVVMNDEATGDGPGRPNCVPLSADALIETASSRFTVLSREDVSMGGWHAYLVAFALRAP